jgi:hypothetical protein
MTEQKSFKRLVRARMEKTGESYTAARANLVAGNGGSPESTATAPPPVFTISEEAIRRRTNRGWEEWFDLLDEHEATDLGHGEIASWLMEEHRVDGWGAQSITVSYERARGMRAVGERPDGFAISASKTIAVPADALYDAFLDDATRRAWLPDDALSPRTATKPRSARFDWGDGTTRVNVGFEVKSDDRSTVFVSHERLPDAAEADRAKERWRAALAGLKQNLEA